MSTNYYFVDQKTKTCFYAGQALVGGVFEIQRDIVRSGHASGKGDSETEEKVIDATSAYLLAKINDGLKLLPEYEVDMDECAELESCIENGELVFKVDPFAFEFDHVSPAALKLGKDFRMKLT